MRTFIAIELPQKIKDILGNIQTDLKQTHADVKWVQPKNIHLTLKFLGEIEESLVKTIGPILSKITREECAFSIYLSKLGAFPKLFYPRVVWIGLTNEQIVIEIAKKINKQLKKVGFLPESRPFNAHITLGRVRSASNRKVLTEKIEDLNASLDTLTRSFQVKELILFKSTLTPQGPIYEKILSSPFRIN